MILLDRQQAGWRSGSQGRDWEISLAGCWGTSKWSRLKFAFICLLLLGLFTLSILDDEREESCVSSAPD